ncbi:hypothetical protein [Streptomyces olivaceus]
MATQTKVQQLFDCTCGNKAEPHKMPVQRVVVTAAPDVAPVSVLDTLTNVWHDATLFYGPEAVMAIAYDPADAATRVIKVARSWAKSHGFTAEPYEAGDPIVARVAPDGAAPVPGDDRPVYRYAA